MDKLNDPALLRSFIQKIYQAILQPEYIFNIVDELRTVVQSPYGAFQVENTFTHELQSSFLIDYDDSAINSYAAYYISRDPWTQIALDKGLLNTRFMAGQRYLADRDYKQSEFYTDWGRKNGVRHAMGGGFEVEDGYVAKISFQRHSDQQAFGQEEETFLNWLHPHFQQFVQLSPLFKQQQEGKNSWEDSFNHFGRPVWLVNRHLKIIYHNQQAELWLQSNPLLNSKAGYLSTPDHLQHSALVHQIEAVSRMLGEAKIDTDRKPSDFSKIQLGNHQLSESLWLSPISHQDDEELVLITGRKSLPSTQQLQRHYQLTPRQAQLCLLLLEGGTPQSASQQLNISINTVRNVLASCFSRLQVSSQAELVQYLSTGPSG